MQMQDAPSRPLREDEVDTTAELMARSFEEDPLMVYLAGGKGSKRNRQLSFYRASIRMGLRSGRVDVLEDGSGVAVWLSPGKTDIGLRQMVQSGMLQAALGMGLMSIRRFFAMYRSVDPMTRSVIQDPYWLLLILAVDPEMQGQGLGGSLIRPVLELADADGVPCYLDSGNERNLSFYRRHGFEVAGEAQVPDGPHVWGMVRGRHAD